MKILLVAGARPNYMKIAPLIRELEKRGRGVQWRLVDTGQHYDYQLSKVFFKEFDIPKPHHFLNAGSGSHGVQTAKIMSGFERVCSKEKPDWVVVVGDVNSTLACSIAAKKMGIKVAHVEAGLRSFDRAMPEEINRIVTDSISDYLFVSEKSGLENLRNEGIGYRVQGTGYRVQGTGKKKEETTRKAKVYFVGNVMIDTLHYSLKKLKAIKKGAFSPALPVTPSPRQLSSPGGRYAVLTLHRPANVDRKTKLVDILRAIVVIAKDMPVFFPCHPRTAKCIADFKLAAWLEKNAVRMLPPLSYLDFLRLWKNADLVLTDSGGIQEETTVLGVPCLTIRDNTERPATVSEGTNILAGTTRKGILNAYEKIKKQKIRKGRIPELWDGRSAGRIVSRLLAKDRR